MSESYQFTVHCWTDRSKRRHFVGRAEAVEYANGLLRAGERASIFKYRPRRSYGDRLAEEDPPPGVKVE